MRGLRRYLTPFAPDQSGVVSVLYELGGIVVICDAGGCTGNVCGFDEPRWHSVLSAVFSAGLRDMDAIMGRDDKLVAELADAATKVDASFAAIVGTPVPAVIGTDYRALARMTERACGLPTIAIDSSGTQLYDLGASKAYRALFERFATEALPVVPGRVGVIGANPLDLSEPSADALREALPRAVCYGMGGTLDDLRRASSAELNVVVAPSGLAAARLLRERFGTPYEAFDPRYRSSSRVGAALRRQMASALGGELRRSRVLVVHQQVSANTIRDELLAWDATQVVCASWFMLDAELAQPQDQRLSEEDDFVELVREGGFDLIVGDPTLWQLVPDYEGATVDLPEFPLSGKLGGPRAEGAS